MLTVLSRARSRAGAWLAPVFLAFVLLAFFVVPGTPLDKFNMICFGI